MQEEVTQKVIALSIKAAKLDAVILQKALKAAIRQIQKQHNKPKQGKQTLRQLKRAGEKITNIPISDQKIKEFDPIAKKYALDYNIKKIEGGEVPRYLVFFKGKDIDSMTEAFREFSAKKLNRDKKPSIHKALAAAKEKAKQLNEARDKVKKLDRGREV